MSGAALATRRPRWRVPVREMVLTIGAVLGVLCLGWALTMSAFGITPLVFTSGSMSPAIATGDLAFVRSVPADQLRRGDVVSVTGDTGVRVTHRITAVERSGDRFSLTLKGDANASPDAAVYDVTGADRVIAHVPKGGYVLSAIASPAGVAVGTLLVACALLAAFGPGSGRPRGGRRRAVAPVVLALVALGAGWQAPPTHSTLAAFTDDASLTTGSFATHTVLPPDSASCSDTLLSATVSWPSKDPRYDYEVVLRRVSTNAVVSTRQITGAGLSTTYVGLTDFLLTSGLSGTVDFRVEIRSKLATATSWQSSTVRTYGNIRVALLGLVPSCTT